MEMTRVGVTFAALTVLAALVSTAVEAAPAAKEKRRSGPAGESDLFRVWDFDQSPVGSVPEGFAASRPGAAPSTSDTWRPRRD